jgi:anionic cell wall polymer biosynthesis LytR-Cps2A-Psr (LCP) family protein
MDGGTALKYARSRNAQGDEGTDLAREKRQQKLIYAIKDRGLSSDVIFSPKTLLKLKDVALLNIETDIDSSAFAIIVRRALSGRDNVDSYVLPEDMLENPPKSSRYDNLYVFIPAGDDPTTPEHDWSKVHKWVECVLGANCVTD